MWTLMVEHVHGAVDVSYHNEEGSSVRAKVESVLRRHVFKSLTDLERNIIVVRAEHDPAAFELKVPSGQQRYFFRRDL